MKTQKLIEEIFEFDSKQNEREVFAETEYKDLGSISQYLVERLSELGFNKMTKI